MRTFSLAMCGHGQLATDRRAAIVEIVQALHVQLALSVVTHEVRQPARPEQGRVRGVVLEISVGVAARTAAMPGLRGRIPGRSDVPHGPAHLLAGRQVVAPRNVGARKIDHPELMPVLHVTEGPRVTCGVIPVPDVLQHRSRNSLRLEAGGIERLRRPFACAPCQPRDSVEAQRRDRPLRRQPPRHVRTHLPLERKICGAGVAPDLGRVEVTENVQLLVIGQ